MSHYQLLILIVVLVSSVIAFMIYNARLMRLAEERNAQSLVAMRIENQHFDRRMRSEMMQMLKPMNAIVARIHETTETYFRDDQKED